MHIKSSRFMEFIKSNFISYFILFIFTLLLSILLLPEEGVFSKAISTFLTFVVFVTLIHINKILFNVFLGLSFLVLLLFFPSETVYGEIDINFAAATYYTSLDETLSYMKQLSLSLFFILFLMLILTIIIMGLKFKIINKKIVFIRSEERRVGKECRSRWWRDYEKRKNSTGEE